MRRSRSSGPFVRSDGRWSREPAGKCSREVCADLLSRRFDGHREPASIQMIEFSIRLPPCRQRLFGKQSVEFTFHRVGHKMAIRGCKSVENQLLDLDLYDSGTL